MVESGIGLAVLPRTAAQRAQRSMAIRVIALTDPWARRRHAICIRSFKSLPAHAQRLVECLRARASSPAELPNFIAAYAPHNGFGPIVLSRSDCPVGWHGNRMAASGRVSRAPS